MVEVPPEIWLYITQFLPKEELYRLIPVNRLFFEVGMNNKWEFVRLSNTVIDRNEPSAIQVLKRLSDPFVASKLKKLYIDVDHLDPPSPNAPAEHVLMSLSDPTFDEIISGIAEAAPHFRNIQYVDLHCL
ncbi:hypothetical protein CPC08DRAFT_760972 [Agrocybe pediades]|nr:hypothetical protein CPC08DRAFT_760972 [Agrocybe pediades]